MLEKFEMSKNDNLCRSNLRLVFSLIVNISCTIFVGWKSAECFIKYFDFPHGASVDIKHSSHTARFPTITICAVDVDDTPPGLRWNISHLNKCGIKGTDNEYETKWIGYGNDGSCKDPKLLWESTVAKVEDMISYAELIYYQKIEKEIYSGDLISPIDTSDGRCYSIIPTLEMIKQGIKIVELRLASLTKIYIHNQGGFEYESSKTVPVKNVMGKKDYYSVEHELLEMLDDKDEPCNDTPKYAKDNCGEDEIEKFVMKEYGCTPPFFKNKEKICTNETITKQVYKYWNNARYYTNCSDPCRGISVSAVLTSKKTLKPEDSRVKFFFGNRVKVVKSYYTYSSLSLIAEIGGYFGLFLGVSINQITYLTSFAQEGVQKYIQWWPKFFKNIKK